ncbi:4-hydroxythreonine-4-phosphate dehydrogenase PdxA [Helicobacter sp. 12S02634-8]|uniref:4-hydroxythreonine-4-phosphate dehydrogenase n=1 Tax=Helicobacter sp. 12S02634-8 TaxID=1476199 RepID=UPI000BA53E69|nr:4-hydroxythreonine-4-phosphate dehydrogenase [Helicobacter sp. 12S02634-8]PAF47781.1 4-hydroxythreonine-4-phosphate dehydrogenase PdxA [Helicobacter sp. 12S02634-8]
MKKIAVSIGDINGIGPQIALTEHHHIKQFCQPIYCAHPQLLQKVCKKLDIPLPKDMEFAPPDGDIPEISPSAITPQSGRYSYESFMRACQLADTREVESICTLPIHKKAWQLAGVQEVGHTEALSKRYQTHAMMMLGCKEMFVALFSDHIPLKAVSQTITQEALQAFLKQLYGCVQMEQALVLGLNPHCGDGGVMGDEDTSIQAAIFKANAALKKEVFIGPISPDTAFSPQNRQKYQFFISMYHDVGLAPLKALYFYESINVTLNIPILRTSVDHGVAYDIAYKTKPNTQSYLNAIDLARSGRIHEKKST